MLNEIFYSECIVCNKKIKYTKLLCNNCQSEIKLINNFCSKCGNPLNINTTFCKNCLIDRNYDYLFALFWYKGAIKEVLKNIKFRYDLKGIFLIKEYIRNSSFDFRDYDIITSCPSHFFRKFKRFIHPTDIVAKELAKKHKVKYQKILKRIKHTDFQWKMDKKNRLKNVKGVFLQRCNLSGLKILLVDDIMTTGATINECSLVLKRAGAVKVDCFVLSRGLIR